MPSTENHGPSSPFASLGRSIFSIRRDQVHSMGPNHDFDSESELESFQKRVTDRFRALATVSDDELLSAAWLMKLLDAFICCQDEFKVILLNNKNLVPKPPLDRMVSEFFDRSVKALDICNATREGIEKVRFWNKHLEIVVGALESKAAGEGQFRRARKALVDVALDMAMEKETGTGSVLSHRNRSFGRQNHPPKRSDQKRSGHSRSLSWSVSRSWSATKQLQSISHSLIPPRGTEIVSTGGLVVPVFTISFVLAFVLWVLVAAIPCQDRGVNVHLSAPRNLSWTNPVLSLYDRILEESKKRDRKGSNGLLKEIYRIEKCTRQLTDLVDLAQFPLLEEHKAEVEQGVEELTLVCESLKNDLDPLERQVRDMFRRIMDCRTEGLELLNGD